MRAVYRHANEGRLAPPLLPQHFSCCCFSAGPQPWPDLALPGLAASHALYSSAVSSPLPSLSAFGNTLARLSMGAASVTLSEPLPLASRSAHVFWAGAAAAGGAASVGTCCCGADCAAGSCDVVGALCANAAGAAMADARAKDNIASVLVLFCIGYLLVLGGSKRIFLVRLRDAPLTGPTHLATHDPHLTGRA